MSFQRCIAFAGIALLCLACGDDDDDDAGSPTGGRAGAAAEGGGTSAAGQAGVSAAGRGSAGRGGAAGSSGSSGAGGSGAGGSGPVAGATAATLGACPAFPSSDAWNRDISSAAVSSEWTAHLHALVGSKKLHPDYGNSGSDHYGIPINPVPSSQAKLPVTFDDYADESDPGPYPFPSADTAIIEGGSPRACDGDCHLIAVQAGDCQLYEGYACLYKADGWHCGNGAVWDLKRDSFGQRREGWTSADAAGLPIAPGLVRYDEAQSGEIKHAIRFTVRCTRDNFVDPATHSAVPGGCSGVAADAPPMGLRVRLKADYDLSKLSGGALAVARAMQRYGMILADNGSDFYFQGERDLRWSENDVEPLKNIPTDAFEALDPGTLKRAQ